MAWAFTCLGTLGVCRCLEYVDEVNCPLFLFVSIQTICITKTIMIMKKQLLLLVILMLPLVASAHDIAVQNADGVTIYYKYINDGKELAVTYRGKYYTSNSDRYTGNIVIPESVNYNDVTYSVTSIRAFAFYFCSGLTSVTIPNSVTSIGESAFEYCSGLTSVTIPNGVTSIGNYTFYDCRRLTSIEIPNSVKSIGEYAFQLCDKLISVTIPNSVTSIGDNAFSSCSGLTSVTIGNSVTSIGKWAFNGCTGLTTVTINSNAIVSHNYSSSSFRDIFGTQVKEYIIGDEVQSIGNHAFDSCSGLTSITIPNSVTSMGNWIFQYCSGLTSITIPNSVTSIGIRAFSGCSSLTSVTIPNSVTSIGDMAFSGCKGLTSITIPNSVTSIGEWVFADCSGLTSVTIGNGVTSIGKYAFSNCTGLTSVTIGKNVTSIGCGAFYEVDIPTIISQIENPSAIYGKSSSSRIFTFNTFNNATLYVPVGTKEKYMATDGWKDFANIVEGVPTGIRVVEKIKNNDITTLYAHCNDIFVKEGDQVKIGQEIAEVGSTGNSTGPHLHFEIKYQNEYINPLDILKY